MQHEKRFFATVDLANPIAASVNKAKYVLTELKATYEGKCYQGAYIVSVDKILSISSIVIQTSNHSGAGTVHVEVAATAVEFAKWDVVAAVKVRATMPMKIGSTTAVLGTGDARAASVVCMLADAPESEVVRAGQTVFVRVFDAHHAAMGPVTVVGGLLTCDRAAPKYGVAGMLTQKDYAELAPVLAAVDREISLRAALYKKRRDRLVFFDMALYAYKSAGLPKATDDVALAGWTGPGDAKAKGLVAFPDLVRGAASAAVDMGGTWHRPLTVHRSSPLVARGPGDPSGGRASSDTKGSGEEIIHLSPKELAETLLKNIYTFLFATRTMTETYDDKLFTDHNNIWLAMGGVQVQK